MLKIDGDGPAAIVLGDTLTTLATVRGLVQAGITVYAATTTEDAPTRYSRCCRTLNRPRKPATNAEALAWLIDFCAGLKHKPVVIPTSDEDALWLAQNSSALRPWCRFSIASYESMLRIVSKDGLYAAARRAGVPVVPSIVEPSAADVSAWSLEHPGPYLLKPFYEQIAGCKLRGKNLLVDDRAALLRYVAREGTRALIIQRKLNGGDGAILDAYGLCSVEGVPLTMASHRRLRQCPSDFGSTCYGEIPMGGSPALETKLFDFTRRLLSEVGYHGIFGIEWLHETTTDELYVIDFNARPFLSIGHLIDSGLNLPLLAYLELIGHDLDDVRPLPVLKRLLWMNVLRDSRTLRQCRNITLMAWLGSILRCHSFAVWNSADPGPWLHQSALMLREQWRKYSWRQESNQRFRPSE